MKNKQQDSKGAEIALTTSENLIEEILDDVAEGVGIELLKAVPFATSILAVGKAISNFRDARYHRNLMAFFLELENNNDSFGEKFFRNKSNAEIGLEILSIVEQVHLEKQAQMIARITRLWKESQEIEKEKFDEYANIILSFDNYIIRQFKKYMTFKSHDNTNQGLTIGGGGIAGLPEYDEMFLHPHMLFVSHGFLVQRTINNVVISGSLAKESHYSLTDKAYDFYNKVFKD